MSENIKGREMKQTDLLTKTSKKMFQKKKKKKDIALLKCHTDVPKYSKHYENKPIQIYWKFYLQKRKILR